MNIRDENEPNRQWSDNSKSSSEFYCVDCGRSDETVRLVSYPYVFSLLVVTFRRAFTGIWCGRHRFLRASLACLVTSIFGWFGFPWGLVFTPVALFELARGGKKDPEANAKILASIGREKWTKGDVDGAVRCFEQSLRFQDQSDIREQLKPLLLQRSQVLSSDMSSIWQLVLMPVILLVLYLIGMVIGLFDYGFSVVLNNLIGENWNMVVFIAAWIPLIFFLFMVLILLRKILEGYIKIAGITSTFLVYALTLLSSIVFVYATACGDAAGRMIQEITFGFQFNSSIEIISTVAAIITRGGLYFLNSGIMSGELWGTFYLVILPGFAILSLIVNLPILANAVKWEAIRKELLGADSGKTVPFGAWLGLGAFIGSFILLFVAFPQQGYVDTFTITDHYYAGYSYLEEGNYEQAIDEFEQVLQLRGDDLLAYYGLGNAYYNQSDFETASQIFTDALTVFPNDFDLLESAGWSYYQLGDAEMSESYFKAALEIFPDSANSKLGIAWIHVSDDPKASIENFKFVLSQYPDSPDAHLGLGIAYFWMTDYDLALDELEQVLTDQERAPVAYFVMGNIYHTKRQYEPALSQYAKAVELVPDYYDAHIGTAKVYIDLEELELASKSLEKAISLNPENPEGFIQESLIYSIQGDYKQAILSVDEAIRLDPENQMALALNSFYLYQMGLETKANVALRRATGIELKDYRSAFTIAATLFHMRRYKEAFSHMEAAADLLPGDLPVQYYVSLANGYTLLGEYDQAHDVLDKAIEADSDDSQIFLARANLYTQQENLDMAMQQYQKASSLDPDDDVAHAGLSFDYLHQGDSDKAAQEAEIAIQKRKYSSWSFENLAFAYHEQGRLEDALEAAKESIRLNPTSDSAHYILGLCYRDLEMNSEAIKEFELFQHYYYERAYIRDYKLKADEYLSTLAGSQ